MRSTLGRSLSQFWLVVDNHDVDLCRIDPRYEADVVVEAGLRSLTELRMGGVRFVEALAGDNHDVGPD